MSAQYSFSTLDGGKTYTRQLFGFEAMLLSLASEAKGLFFYNASASLRLPSVPALDKLKAAIEASWIELRFASPQVACITSLEKSPHAWKFTYDALTDPSDLTAWAQKTIKWHDEEKDLLGHYDELSETYWDPASNQPSMILHVLPINKAQGQWLLVTQQPHSSIDGRGALFLFDHFCTTLNRELSLASPTSLDATIKALQWGAETARLPAAPAVLTGEFDRFAATVPVAPGPPPPGFIPFFPPLVKNPDARTVGITRKISLNEKETARLRAVCKLNGRTVTQVVDSAFAAAMVEATLMSAPAHGEEHTQAVIGTYEQATHWIEALSFKDQRITFPNHSKFFGPEGSAPFSTDGYDLAVSMAELRNAVIFNKDTHTIKRNTSKSAFWDGLVTNYVEAFSRNKGDHESYIIREIGKHSQASAVSTGPMTVRAGAASSIGHVERLGVLVDFLPSTATLAKKEVVVEEVFSLVRADLPLMIILYWQYNGELTASLYTARAYQTDADMDVMAEAFKGWLLDLIA